MDRFRALVRRQWAENRTTYLFVWIFISISLVLLGILSQNTDAVLLYLMLFCFGGAKITSTGLNQATQGGRTSQFLLLPASAAEKLLAGIFFSVAVYIPFYCLNFIVFRYGIANLFMPAIKSDIGQFPAVMGNSFREIGMYPFSFYVVWFLAFLFVQSIYSVILVRFRRFHMMILGITILAIFFVYNMGMVELMTLLSPIHLGRVINPGIFLTFMSPDFGYGSGEGFGWQAQYFSFSKPIRYLNDFIWYVVFGLLYVSAWFGLKEREI
jgi:hypothetical protein